VKVYKTSEIKERTCIKSCAQYQSTNTGYSRLITWISRLILYIVDQAESWGSKSRQSSRLVFGPSRLMSGITVSFSGFVSRFDLDSSFLYSEALIVRIDEICLELGEFYDL